jgi:hypothetical protein
MMCKIDYPMQCDQEANCLCGCCVEHCRCPKDNLQRSLELNELDKETKAGACNFCGEISMPAGRDVDGFPFCKNCKKQAVCVAEDFL